MKRLKTIGIALAILLILGGMIVGVSFYLTSPVSHEVAGLTFDAPRLWSVSDTPLPNGGVQLTFDPAIDAVIQVIVLPQESAPTPSEFASELQSNTRLYFAAGGMKIADLSDVNSPASQSYQFTFSVVTKSGPGAPHDDEGNGEGG